MTELGGPGRAIGSFARYGDNVVMRVMVDQKSIEMAWPVETMLEHVAKKFPEYGITWGIPESQGNGDMPTLSIAMIVKNEEKWLPRCLDSIREVADEIIIVDTGSTDETVTIAKCYTDKVYFHEWNDSFSEARNHSLSYCTCDWILQIDADEELVRDDIPILQEGLRRLGGRGDIDRVMLIILNETKSATVSRNWFPRLFRRGRCHFEGIVHNQLRSMGGKSAELQVRIVHYGYNLPEDETATKVARTERLLRKQIAEDSENPIPWGYLLHSRRNREDWPFIIENAHHVLRNERTLQFTGQTTAGDLAVAYMQTDEPDKGIAICQAALKQQPDNADIIWILAWLYKQKGEVFKAITRVKRFLSVRDHERVHGAKANAMFCDTWGTAPKARLILAEWEKELVEMTA